MKALGPGLGGMLEVKFEGERRRDLWTVCAS